MSETRALTFPLVNSASVSAITDTDASVIELPIFPEDPNEKTFVLLHVSANEYKRIASSIDIGADIGYPDDSVGVWYTWVRATMSDSACEIISNCILNNEGTRDAVADVFLSNTTPQYYEQLLEKLKEDLELGVTPVNPINCNDNLWGAIRQFVDIICDDVTDYLELLDANPADQLLDIIDALAKLPVVDEIGIDALVDFVSWVSDQLAVYYAASLTDEYKEQLACDIFCSVKDSCIVSVDDVYQVILERVNPDFNVENFIEVLVNLVEFAFVGAADFVVDLWLFTMFRFASLADFLFKLTGNNGTSYATTRLRKQLMLGLNNPDSDWSTLCLDCAPIFKNDIPAYGRGYKINNGEFVIVNPVTDDSYILPPIEIGDEVTLITNGIAVAIGDCASSFLLRVEVIARDGGTAVVRYRNGDCVGIGEWTVGNIYENEQLNQFYFGTATFKILG